MTLPVLPYGTPLEGANAGQWAAAICDALKAPVNEANVYSFAGWFLREGGGGENNPMNTTLGSQYPAINLDGVRNFPTPEIGIAQTVATLEDGYPSICASFRAGVGLEHPNAATAAELSKWSGGGYSFISPVVVPLPVPPTPPKSMHYDWFAVGHQRKIVERYDKLRAHPAKNKVALASLRVQLKAAAVVTLALYKAHKKNTKHYGWRYQQLIARSKNLVVKPS